MKGLHELIGDRPTRGNRIIAKRKVDTLKFEQELVTRPENNSLQLVDFTPLEIYSSTKEDEYK